MSVLSRVVFVLLLLVVPARADIDCDGTNDLISSVLSLDTFLNNTVFTIMAWVKSTGSTFGADDSCWTHGPFVMDSNEVLALGRNGTSGTGQACAFLETSPARQVNVAMTAGWHHLAATYSAGTLTLYIDGVSAGSQSGGGALDLVDGTLHLCGQADGTSPDRITEVKIYDVVVPLVEIERAGKSRLRRVERTAPTAHWPLQECPHMASGHGVSFPDRSGNNRHLTGNDGGNGGLTCRGSERLSRPWGVQ